MVVSGAVESTTVHAWVVASASDISSGTSTRTSNSWGPSGTPMYSFGDRQREKFPVSSAHSYWRPLPSAENSNVAVRLSVVTCGPDVIMTDGGIVWTLQLHSAG